MFKINEALDSKPVKLRNGAKAVIRYVETQYTKNYGQILIGVSENGYVLSWDIDGNSLDDKLLDIISMWEDPKFEHWGLLIHDIVCIAKDGFDGQWYGYTDIPTMSILGIGWKSKKEVYPLGYLPLTVFPKVEWKNSLVMRPAQ